MLKGKVVLGIGVFLLAGGSLESTNATIGLSVTPPILDVAVPPGATKTFTLDVRNTGDVTLIVSPEVMDLELTEEGIPVAIEAASTRYSCASWISMDTQPFTLGANESLRRSFKLAVPSGSTGGRYAIILFDAQPIKAELKQPHLTVGARTGTILMETIPRRLSRRGEIISVTAKAVGDTVTITGLFQNKGDVHLKIKPSCLIRDKDGRIVDRIKIEAGTGTVLPDGKRPLKGLWTNKHKMKPGRYTAEISVEFRGAERVKASTEFLIKEAALRGQNPVSFDRKIICMEALNSKDERR